MLFVLVASNMVGAKTQEEKYEDLIYKSMESIVSLNDLVTDLGVKVTRLTTEVAEVKMKLEKTIKTLNYNVETTEKLDLEIEYINEDMAAVATSVAETNVKVDAMGGEVMIVSGEQAAGDEKCRRVCAGTTGRTTDWYDWGSTRVYYTVDISDCGFTTIPTVTTSLEGKADLTKAWGTSSLWNATPTSFKLVIKHDSYNLQGGFAEDRDWNIEWIAVGYTC